MKSKVKAKRVTSQVRVPVDLFVQLKMQAFKRNMTLSRFAEGILRDAIKNPKLDIRTK